MMSMRVLGRWLVVGVGLGIGGVAEAAPVVSSFDFDEEGWTANGAVVAQEAAGGNPGGFLSVTDTADDTAAAVFPDAFLGNLLRFDGGKLTYDFLVLEPPTPLIEVGSGFGRIQMNGGGSNATFDHAPNPPIPSTEFWTPYAVPMTAAAWDTTQANWEQVLSDVTHLDIIVQAGTTVGLDNVQLSPIPEPSSLILLGLGWLGLAGAGRRRGGIDGTRARR